MSDAGSTTEADQRRLRVLGLALEVAAIAPERQSQFTTDAKVPWWLINELREAISDRGTDWRKFRRDNRCQRCGWIRYHTTRCDA